MIALLIEDYVRDLGGSVVVSCGEIAEAEAFMDGGAGRIGFAILDLSVQGVLSTPVAERLRLLGIPFVFCTGYDAGSIPAEWLQVPRLRKPFNRDEVARLARIALAAADPG